MNKELKIKIKIDKDTGAVKVVGNEFDTLNTKTKNTSTSMKSIGTDIDNVKGKLLDIALGAGAIYAVKEAFEFAVKSGFSFNNSLEQSTQGLTALTVATSSNTSALGKHLDLTQKYSLAAIEAIESVKGLQKINADTPHTLNQTNEIYKAMYVSMKKVGASNGEMINITKKMSIAAGSAGIEFQSLLAGVDGLATGTVLANSDLGRFLSGLGLTNDVLKESDDVIKLLEDRLSQFKAADTMNVAVSNLGNSWDQLAGTMTEDIFEDVKEGAKELSGFLDNLNKDVKLLKYWFAEPADLKTLDDVEDKIADISKRISEQNKIVNGSYENVFSLFESKDLAKDAIKEYKKQLEELIEIRDKLVKTESKDSLVGMGKDFKSISNILYNSSVALDAQQKAIDNVNTELVEQIRLLEKAGASEEEKNELVQNYALQLEEINEKFDKDKTAKLNIKTTMDSATKEFYTLQDKLTTIEQSLNITIEDDPFYEVSLKYANLRGTVALNPLHTQVQLDLVDDALIDEISSINAKKIKLEVEIEVSNLDNMDAMTDLLDLQIGLANSSDNWVTNLQGSSGALLQAGKVFSDIDKDKKKRESADLKAQKKYAKSYLKANGDVSKEKKASAEFDSTQSAIRESEMDSYIGAFSNLSTAVSSYGAQSATASKVAIEAEKGLAVVQGIRAVIRAWGDPYPLNIVTVPLTMAAVGGLLGQMGASGGGGGSAPSALEVQQENFEANMDFEIDQLNRTNELLESIDNKSGSVSAGNVGIAQANYNKDIGLLSFEVAKIASIQEKTGLENRQIVAEIITNLETALNKGLSEADKKDIGQINNGQMIQGTANEDGTVSFDFIKGITKAYLNFSSLVEDISGTLTTVSFLNDLKEEDPDQFKKFFPTVDLRKWVGDAQTAVNDYAISMIDVVGEMRSASDTFKDVYEEISETNKFQNEKLTKAFADFDSLRKENSYEDYLLSQIEAIKSVSDEIGTDLVDLLIDTDIDKIQQQVEAVNKLSEITGIAFENGVKEAINFVDSIELVGNALATSTTNIKSIMDSFRTDDSLAQIQASNLGVNLATTAEQYFAQFEDMKNDLLGLTDEELSYLEASKTLIESKNEELLESQEEGIQAQIDSQNEYIASLNKNVNTIAQISKSLDSVIDKFEANSYGDSFVLSEYYSSMSKSLTLSKTDDYTSFQEELKNTIKYSDSLFKESNFSNEASMQFAQAVALNQFDGMELAMDSELDYLKQIEENTSNTVNALTAQLQSISSNISGSNSSLQDFFENNYNVNTPVVGTSKQTVLDAYGQITNRAADQGGLNYWVNELDNNPNITNSNLLASMARGADYIDMPNALAWMKKNNVLSGQALLDSHYAKGNISDKEANTLLDQYGITGQDTPSSHKNNMGYNTYKNLWKNAINSFDVGTGYVPQDQLAMIHRGEIITPPDMSEDIREGKLTLGSNNALLEENKKLNEKIDKMATAMDKMAGQIENMNDNIERDFRTRQQA